MRRWGVAAALASLLGTTAAHAFEVESLRNAGPVDKRFNIAVLGDGYRSQDQTKLKTDAQDIIGYLFGVTPIKQYEKFFNVKLIHVISNQDGADNGSAGGMRDTALDAVFNCDNIDRLLCVNDGKVATIAAQDMPEYNFAIVIVNDTKYGGSGGGIVACSANDSAFEVMAHEVGHSLARLADEYSYEGNQPACDQTQDCSEANATIRTSRDQIKWKDWIEAGTPVPTPDSSQYDAITGLFEGARYTPTGVYRPARNCKMRDLGADYCSVCTEQFVRSIWTSENIQMIEELKPPQQNVTSTGCEPIELGVTVPPITPSTYTFTWTVDGKPTLDTTATVKLSPAALMPGSHEVKLAIEDTTAMVRNDPQGVLKDAASWTLSVQDADCPSGGGGGAGGFAGMGGGGAGAGGGGAGGGGGSAGAGGSGGAGGVAGAVAVAGGGQGGVARPLPPPNESSGCGCALPGGEPTRAWPWSLLALAAVLGRRRHR